ncbi:transforming growth factor beta activator LRRC32 [Microcaecilia unicolor]|uniref:Transforming growth factor beta activator LRRC32-like n=1 Tax=Microcaecilia unicolor TaxID=1415580 RepID=A0A6P7YDE0_9AMPH|nr:transforming growth factor beta activator LRRC32-like [Microcaecilia unicolor]
MCRAAVMWMLILLPEASTFAHILQSMHKIVWHHQNLSAFPENLAPGVKTLDLSHNFIHSLTESSTSELLSLQHLNLSSNRLDSIKGRALSTLPQLQSLILASNQLHRNYLSNGKALASFPRLKFLDLSANNLDSDMVCWYLMNITSLEKLDLSCNKMTKVSAGMFNGTLNLVEISLTNNYIMVIEEGAFVPLANLRVLNLAINSLHCISSFSLINLQVLNLSYNALECFITDESDEPHRLQVLDLSHNQLFYFPLLPKVHHIQYLNLSSNAMIALVPSSVNAMEPSRTTAWYEEITNLDLPTAILKRNVSLVKVVHLDLSNNQLPSFPIHFLARLFSLQHLRMAMNCLQDLTLMQTTNNLSTSEDISNVPDRHNLIFKSLRNLELQGNSIQVLPRWLFVVMPQLERIDLSHNNIEPCRWQATSPSDREDCVTFSSVPNLKELNLRGNGITRLSPYMFNQTPLISLDLSANKGLHMPGRAMLGLELTLQKLSLRENQMESSEMGFPCLKTLRILDVSENKLNVLPSNLDCSPLESLDIRNNSLEMLGKSIPASWTGNLKTLFISGNFLSCCALSWLKSLQFAKVNVPDLDDAHCVYHGKDGSSPAKVASDHSHMCPPLATSGVSDILAIVAIVLLLAVGCRMFFSLKKGCTLPKAGFGHYSVLSRSREKRGQQPPMSVI